MFASTQTGDKINSALDAAINFRNGQMNINSAQEAFKILQKTAAIDILKANEENGIYKSANEGFRALHGADPPQEIYSGLVNNDDEK